MLLVAAAGSSVYAQSPAAEPAAQPGGTIVVGEWQAAKQLNPYMTTALADVEAYTPILHGLFTVNNDGQWVTDLAAEIPSVDNGGLVDDAKGGFTVTLKLKPGLMWSDGTPLTMNDFKGSYEWAIATGKANVGCTTCATFAPVINTVDKKGNPLATEKYWAPENQFVESITVSEDGQSAVVKWRQDYAGWLAWAATFILPAEYFKNVTPEDAVKVMAVGSDTLPLVPANGPFIITSASADGIDYAKNPNWKATEGPYLDGLKFRFFGTKDGMITSFLNGEIDLALNMTLADYAAISGVDASIGTALLDKAYAYEHLDLQTSHKNVGLDDVNVRRAIQMGINKEEIFNVLFPGAEPTVGCTPAPPNMWYYKDVTCPTFNPEEAAKALDDAGWKINEESGFREKDGKQLRLHMCTTSGNPTRLTTLGKVNQYLNALGIPSDIQTADPTSVVFAGWASTTKDTDCSIFRGTYDVALFTYSIGIDPYSNMFYAYHTSQIPSDKNPNGANDTRFSNKEMDEALAGLGKELDLAKQKELAGKAIDIYVDQVPEISLYYRAETTGLGNHLGGFGRYNPSSAGATWNTEAWHFIP